MIKSVCVLRARIMAAGGLPIGTNALRVYGASDNRSACTGARGPAHGSRYAGTANRRAIGQAMPETPGELRLKRALAPGSIAAATVELTTTVVQLYSAPDWESNQQDMSIHPRSGWHVDEGAALAIGNKSNN